MTDRVEKRLAELVHEATAPRDMKVRALAVMPDHLHLVIETDCGLEL